MNDTPEAPAAEGVTVQGTDGRAVELNAAAVASLEQPQPVDVDANGTAPPRPPATPFTRDGKGLTAALDLLGIELRLNTREHRCEFRTPTVNDGDWWPSSDEWEAALVDTIADRFCTDTKGRIPLRFGRDTWNRSLLAMQWYAQVDPFRYYLEHRTWDGVARIEHWPAVVFDCNHLDPLVQWFGRFLFLGPVLRTFDPGYDLHETPVLIGPQDAGKSSAVRWALPQTIEARRWFSDGLNLAADDQKRVEALIGRVLVEASDLAGGTRAELQSLKSFLTRSDDGSVRLPWRRNTEMLLRTCCVIGTADRAECLPNDSSGNRRFVPIDIYPGKAGHQGVRDYMDVNRSQLWGEAVQRYRDGETARLPSELKQRQADANTEHRRSDEVLEVRLQDWLTDAPVLFELADAAAGCGLCDNNAAAVKLHRAEQHRMADALRTAGYGKAQVRVDGRRVWRWRHAG